MKYNVLITVIDAKISKWKYSLLITVIGTTIPKWKYSVLIGTINTKAYKNSELQKYKKRRYFITELTKTQIQRPYHCYSWKIYRYKYSAFTTVISVLITVLSQLGEVSKFTCVGECCNCLRIKGTEVGWTGYLDLNVPR